MDSTAETVKTRFCIVSDTHNHSPKPSDADKFAYRQPLPSADVLLHAGDLTMCGELKEYKKILKWIMASDAELKIVIAGNHDIDLHEEYYLTHAGEKDTIARKQVREVKDLWTGPEARSAGVVYLDEGVNTFTLKNGATFTIYTSPWQPEFWDWAFNYPHDEDRFNPPSKASEPAPANPVPSWPNVDVMLTHGPPHGILDATSSGEMVGCKFLRNASQRCRPRLHCFGHIHEGWGAQRIQWERGTIEKATPESEQMLKNRSAYLPAHKDGPAPMVFGEETIFVNASIMNINYRPVNAPWVVDIDLRASV
ncbi:MAG: hypothetical protein Q9191_003177 [Dirinaria sp. TL-2023a]